MSGKPAARGCDHPQYPEYAERFAEDPARFVYHLPVRPRIRGIEDLGLLSAYLHVLDEYRQAHGATLTAGGHNEDIEALIGDIQDRMERLKTDVSATADAAVATDGGEPQ
jgi:hypothetical protein